MNKIATLPVLILLGMFLSGGRGGIGSSLHDHPISGIYLLDRELWGAHPWGVVTCLAGEDSVAGDKYGYWTSIDGNLVQAGAPGNPPHGAAHGFNLDPDGWATC